MTIKDFAAQFVKAEDAAFQKGDFSALSKIEDPNVVMHLGPPFGDMFGHEAHKQYIIGARKASNDFKQDWKFLAGRRTCSPCPTGRRDVSRLICLGFRRQPRVLTTTTCS